MNALEKIESFRNLNKELKALVNKSETVLQALKTKFHLQDTAQQGQESRQGDLFEGNPSPETHKFFYNDPKAWEHIQKFIPPKYQRNVKDDFDWFAEEINKSPNQRKKYYRDVKEQDDKTVIEKFCNLKLKDNLPYFPQDIRLKVKEYLMSIYCKDDK